MLICILFSFSFLLLPGLPWWLRSNLPAMQEPQEDTVRSLGWKDPLEKSMATHSSILTWRIPWTEESGRLQFLGLQKVRHGWSDLSMQWLMMLNFFHMSLTTSTWSLKKFYLTPLSILKIGLSLCWVVRFLCIFWIKVLYLAYDL